MFQKRLFLHQVTEQITEFYCAGIYETKSVKSEVPTWKQSWWRFIVWDMTTCHWQVVWGTWKDENVFIFRERLQSFGTLGTTHIQHSIILQKSWISGTETGWWNWEMNPASKGLTLTLSKRAWEVRLLTSYCHVMKVTETVCVETLQG